MTITNHHATVGEMMESIEADPVKRARYYAPDWFDLETVITDEDIMRVAAVRAELVDLIEDLLRSNGDTPSLAERIKWVASLDTQITRGHPDGGCDPDGAVADLFGDLIGATIVEDLADLVGSIVGADRRIDLPELLEKLAPLSPEIADLAHAPVGEEVDE